MRAEADNQRKRQLERRTNEPVTEPKPGKKGIKGVIKKIIEVLI